MSLPHAVLGFLSWQPLSGYDLKKIFTNFPAVYWSGNNNQIYTALLHLERQGFVMHEVHLQATGPAKKVYTITQPGLEELRRWVLSQPEPPELRRNFLIQLTWADLLSPSELDELLERYEEEVRVQLRMAQENARLAGSHTVPQRTPREAYLSAMVAENGIAAYQSELAWVQRLRAGLTQFQT